MDRSAGRCRWPSCAGARCCPRIRWRSTRTRQFDRQSQRALSRYYIDAGAGGLAVGVHATQFQIREAGLYRPVLELAAETARSWTERPLVMIAGVIGKTAQAVEEARTRARARLPRRAAGPRRHEGRQRGRDHRALRARSPARCR